MSQGCHSSLLMSLILHFEFAVINTMAKIALLLFTVMGKETMNLHMVFGDSTCHGHWHGVWRQYRTQTSTWPSTSVWAQTHIAGSAGQGHQHGLR